MNKHENDLVNAVIEIDGVDYFIDEETANKILRKENVIPLRRLIDQEIRTISLESILKIIQEGGITDHL